MIAFVHAYYLLGLQHAEGWVGYGGKIHSGRFRALAPPGEPLLLACKAVQKRVTPASVFARYVFEFIQGGKSEKELQTGADVLEVDLIGWTFMFTRSGGLP
jgi:hypothetical protein